MLPRMKMKTLFLLSFVGHYVQTGKMTQDHTDYVKNKCLAPYYLLPFEVTAFRAVLRGSQSAKQLIIELSSWYKNVKSQSGKSNKTKDLLMPPTRLVFSCYSGGGAFNSLSVGFGVAIVCFANQRLSVILQSSDRKRLYSQKSGLEEQ